VTRVSVETMKMVEAMRNTAKPGVKESVVYGNMIQSMIADGGEIPTMLSWLSGPWGHVSRRLTIATQRVMAKGDVIMNEIEARYAGYCGQQDQPLFLGPIPAAAGRTRGLRRKGPRARLPSPSPPGCPRPGE